MHVTYRRVNTCIWFQPYICYCLCSVLEKREGSTFHAFNIDFPSTPFACVHAPHTKVHVLLTVNTARRRVMRLLIAVSCLPTGTNGLDLLLTCTVSELLPVNATW
jgi:hypothetical protein